MSKSPDAFRTISEVAEWLDTPAHVLRFWESRFAQVKPVKRAGGRRYYRPADMLLLGGIKKLLHEDGMTIRGVQKLLREEGIKHVAAFSMPIDAEGETTDSKPESRAPAEITDTETADTVAEAPMQVDVPEEPLDNVVALTEAAPEPKRGAEPEPTPQSEAEADLTNLEKLDGQSPQAEEPGTEALFAESLNQEADEPPASGVEPALPFGRGRTPPDEASPEASVQPTPALPPEPATTAVPASSLGRDIADDPEDSELHTDIMPLGLDITSVLRKIHRNGAELPQADRLLPYYARLKALRNRMDRH